MTEPDCRVFVVDDDAAVRDAIGLLLETEGLACQTFDSAEAFLEAHGPDRRGCLVLDIRMPGMDGLELQRRLREMDAPLPVVFITGHGDIPMAVEAMKQGAVDFIRKPFGEEELLERVREALYAEAGQRADAARLHRSRDLIASLTPREVEVFERVADGQANKVVALELGISERTVEIHRSQVMRKTTCRTLADLVRLKLTVDQAGG